MVDEILAKATGATSSSPSVSVTSTTEQAPAKVFNGLATRTESDYKRLTNDIFDRGEGDDDL
jgi:hypothetical protein